VTNESTPCGSSASGVECREALDRLFEYLDEELPDADAARMRAHIEDCAPCLQELGIEEHVKMLVRRSCTEEAPAQLHLRILEQITVLRESFEH